MTLEQIFSLASTLALAGWVAMLASPWFPRFVDIVSGYAIPAVLSLGYLVVLMVYWGQGTGGDFGSLDGVARLFSARGALLAGWIHYLAFDMFVGAWEIRTARREGLSFWLVVPCLVATFLIGPVGLVLFLTLRLVTGRTSVPFARATA